MAFDKDLVVLVPDGAIYSVVATLLEKRRPSLGLRQVAAEIIKDVWHDSSAESKAVELLRGFLRIHERALILRDLAGSGWETRGARSLEQALAAALAGNGWPSDRIAAIVIEPELEIWLRIGSPHVQTLIGEFARRNTAATGLRFAQQVQTAVQKSGGELRGKPRQPKEAFESVLEHFGVPRSNALYRRLSERESLTGCAVPSFQRFVGILQAWFPA